MRRFHSGFQLRHLQLCQPSVQPIKTSGKHITITKISHTTKITSEALHSDNVQCTKTSLWREEIIWQRLSCLSQLFFIPCQPIFFLAHIGRYFDRHIVTKWIVLYIEYWTIDLTIFIKKLMEMEEKRTSSTYQWQRVELKWQKLTGLHSKQCGSCFLESRRTRKDIFKQEQARYNHSMETVQHFWSLNNIFFFIIFDYMLSNQNNLLIILRALSEIVTSGKRWLNIIIIIESN